MVGMCRCLAAADSHNGFCIIGPQISAVAGTRADTAKGGAIATLSLHNSEAILNTGHILTAAPPEWIASLIACLSATWGIFDRLGLALQSETGCVAVPTALTEGRTVIGGGREVAFE